MRLSRHHARGGFTLIEVMVSLGVMMVGSMAVIALQQQSVRANIHARQLTIAMGIAERWMERLKQDAHTWTSIGTDDGSITTALAQTVFLKQHLSGMTNQPSEFKPLQVATPSWSVSNLFDQRGRDMPIDPGSSDSIHTYCASYRPAWIWRGHLMRVDVRVWWARDVTKPDGTSRPNIDEDFTDGVPCQGDDVKLRPDSSDTNSQFPWYHVVYLSGAVRTTEVRR